MGEPGRIDAAVDILSEIVVATFYFSAYAHWLPISRKRHREYAPALRYAGVVQSWANSKIRIGGVLLRCGAGSVTKKETDVNIALYLLNGAHHSSYDGLILFLRDSDLKPAVEMVLKQFPNKDIVIVAPPELGHSNDLTLAAGNKEESNGDRLRIVCSRQLSLTLQETLSQPGLPATIRHQQPSADCRPNARLMALCILPDPHDLSVAPVAFNAWATTLALIASIS